MAVVMLSDYSIPPMMRMMAQEWAPVLNTSPAPLGLRAWRYSIMTTLDSERTLISAESYFKTQPPPSTLEYDIASVRSFIHRQRDLGNKVVLVTVSIRPRATLCRLERLTHSQERRNDCPFGAQCVSSILCITARFALTSRCHVQGAVSR